MANAISTRQNKLLHNKHVAILGLAVVFVFVLAAINLDLNTTGFATNDAQLTSNLNVVEKQILPSKVADCDPSNPLNIYQKTVSNKDGTADIYTFNACYLGCTGITTYDAKTMAVLSEKTKCERD